MRILAGRSQIVYPLRCMNLGVGVFCGPNTRSLLVKISCINSANLFFFMGVGIYVQSTISSSCIVVQPAIVGFNDSRCLAPIIMKSLLCLYKVSFLYAWIGREVKICLHILTSYSTTFRFQFQFRWFLLITFFSLLNFLEVFFVRIRRDMVLSTYN